MQTHPICSRSADGRTKRTRGFVQDLILAVLAAFVLFALLPAINWISGRSAEVIPWRPVQTIETPPPPLEVEQPVEEPRRADVPEPTWKEPAPERPDRPRLQIDFPALQGAADIDWSVELPNIEAPASTVSLYLPNQLDDPPRPLVRLKPLYPSSARLQRIEGYVLVEFVVSDQGRTRDLRVIESEPASLFDAAALQAVRRWRFEPGQFRGKPVNTRVRQRIVFELENL